MRKFKKIELFPLTNLENLELSIASTKHFDLTGLEVNQTDLLKLFNFVATTPEIIVGTKIGDKTFVNTHIKGSANRKRIFSFPEPNPICIYYISAIEHLENSYKLKNKLFTEEQHFDANYHYDNFIEYYKETSQGIILLITTIEGFINQLLAEDLELEIDGKNKNKKDIEWMDLHKKIRKILPQLTGIDFEKSNNLEYTNICLVIDLRNDLIHLKRSEKKNITNYQLLFKRLLDFDHIGCSDSIFTFINTILPNYLIEKNQSCPK